MLQVKLFNYPTLTELEDAQDVWFKKMCEKYQDFFKIIEIIQSGSPNLIRGYSAVNVLISVYYTT